MRVQDVENFWRRVAGRTYPPGAGCTVELHYLSVLSAIANGAAYPDPEALAQAVMRGVAGDCHTPEVRYVRSSDQASSGDGIP